MEKGVSELLTEPILADTKDIWRCNYFTSIRYHAWRSPTRISCRLRVCCLCARWAGVLADQHLSVPGGAGRAAGLKVAALVAGMIAGRTR